MKCVRILSEKIAFRQFDTAGKVYILLCSRVVLAKITA